MDLLAAMGVAAIIEATRDKAAMIRIKDKLAKVFVTIERAAELNPTLLAAIEKARSKQ